MSERGLFWVGEILFWVDGSASGCMGHYFWYVGISRGKWALFWVGGGRWGIMLGGWGRVEVSRGGALFDNPQDVFIE